MAHPVRSLFFLDVSYKSPLTHLLVIIRSYIYVPLGGSNSTIIPKLLVFTFVALWHDLSMRLLVWGWLISLFILPEVIASKVLSESKVRSALAFFLPILGILTHVEIPHLNSVRPESVVQTRLCCGWITQCSTNDERKPDWLRPRN